MHKPSRLVDAELIVRKGDAAPTVTADRDPAPSPPVPPSPPLAQPPAQGTIAVTVRLDPARYERLKIYGVRHRRTNQDLLTEALDAFLASRE